MDMGLAIDAVCERGRGLSAGQTSIGAVGRVVQQTGCTRQCRAVKRRGSRTPHRPLQQQWAALVFCCQQQPIQ
jgi:hypothetical protein